MDHFAAIVTLLSATPPNHSSSYALVRPCVESYVRGLWIAVAATQPQIERFFEGTALNFPAMLDAIEKKGPAGSVAGLRRLYDSHFSALHGFTHGGAEHIARWGQGEIMEPQFSVADDLLVLEITSRTAMNSALFIAGNCATPNANYSTLSAGVQERVPLDDGVRE